MSQAKRIWVCVEGRYCCQRNPDKVLEALQASVTKQGASDQIEVCGGGCLGMCGHGPNALVMIGRQRVGYCGLSPQDADEIIAAHTNGDRPVERLRITRKYEQDKK